MGSVARNTLLAAIRLVVVTLSSVFSIRLAVHAMGVEMYGVYGVLLNISVLSTFAMNALSAVTQQQIAVRLGHGDDAGACRTFTASVQLHTALALVILIGLETIGVWSLGTVVAVNPAALAAARIALRITGVTTALTVMTSPLYAILYSTERIGHVTIVGIVDSTTKIASAALLSFAGNRLVAFSALTCAATFVTLLFALVASRRVLARLRPGGGDTREVRNQLLGLSSWGVIGAFAGLVNVHGVSLIVNNFLGAALVAIRNIGQQVGSAALQPAASFQSVTAPTIAKTYAIGGQHAAEDLVQRLAKCSCLLCLTIAIPVFIEAPSILSAWIGSVDPTMISFARLALVYTVVDALSPPLQSLALSTGRLAAYQITVSAVSILILPGTYIALAAGFPPQSIYYVAIGTTACCFSARAFMVISSGAAEAWGLLWSVFSRCGATAGASAVLPALAHAYLPAGIIRLGIVALAAWAGIAICAGTFGLAREDRQAAMVALRGFRRAFGSAVFRRAASAESIE